MSDKGDGDSRNSFFNAVSASKIVGLMRKWKQFSRKTKSNFLFLSRRRKPTTTTPITLSLTPVPQLNLYILVEITQSASRTFPFS